MKKLMDILPINNRNENNETLENRIYDACCFLPRLLQAIGTANDGRYGTAGRPGDSDLY